jgi:hypothetical protein
MNAKLPKQWLYWAKKARLKPERRRGKDKQYKLVGRGRRWRVNSFGNFEVSCPIEHFDRWANSFGACVLVAPQTEKEFLTAVHNLIIESNSFE